MTDFEYRKTLIVGAIIGASIMLLAIYMFEPSAQTTPVTPKSHFAVVATYKGCDVVQWTNGMQAEYKYFLICKE